MPTLNSDQEGNNNEKIDKNAVEGIYFPQSKEILNLCKKHKADSLIKIGQEVQNAIVKFVTHSKQSLIVLPIEISLPDYISEDTINTYTNMLKARDPKWNIALRYDSKEDIENNAFINKAENNKKIVGLDQNIMDDLDKILKFPVLLLNIDYKVN
jgi:agmatine/peptidylarginine deiminase